MISVLFSYSRDFSCIGLVAVCRVFSTVEIDFSAFLCFMRVEA